MPSDTAVNLQENLVYKLSHSSAIKNENLSEWFLRSPEETRNEKVAAGIILQRFFIGYFTYNYIP